MGWIGIERADYDREPKEELMPETDKDDRKDETTEDPGSVTIDEPTEPALSGTDSDDFGTEAPEPGVGSSES
jgi:hypothetical protein